MDSELFRSGVCRRLWTPADTAWRSTDQKTLLEEPGDILAEALDLSEQLRLPGTQFVQRGQRVDDPRTSPRSPL
jgi:hypothetical protein